MKAVTVPVMVDDRKDVGEFQMTRATYFYVEAVELSPDIPIDHVSLGMPVLPLEFSGVIYKPFGTAEQFETPEQFEELFQVVEQHKALYVDSDNIWIPNDLLDKAAERGNIYRVSFDLFAQLYPLCRGDATMDADMTQIDGKSGLVTFSRIETQAYEKWTKGIVADAKATYHMNKSLALPYDR